MREPWRSAQMPASGEAIEHPDRHRRELDAGGDRVVALRALEVEDEDEQQREAREAVDERGAGGGGEQPVLEDRQVEHRRAAAVLDQHEQRQQHDARRSRPPITTGSSQPEMPPLRDAEHEPGEAGDERRACRARSSPRSVSRLRQLAQDAASPRARRRAPSGTLNQKTQCQEIDDQRAAEHRPDARARPRRPSCSCPSPAPSCSRGKASVTSAAALANRNAPPMPWTIRHRISSVPLAGEAGAERGEREDDEAADVGAACARRGRTAGRR